jgi:ATP-dependent exoDNAse (exonuclease V) alpha subunit
MGIICTEVSCHHYLLIAKRDLPLIQATATHVRRLQYPIKLSFALTIDKSQGQSLDVVGVDLRKDVFGHRQLYVALSRATNASRMWVLLPDDEHGRQRKAFNKVYPQIRQD